MRPHLVLDACSASSIDREDADPGSRSHQLAPRLGPALAGRFDDDDHIRSWPFAGRALARRARIEGHHRDAGLGGDRGLDQLGDQAARPDHARPQLVQGAALTVSSGRAIDAIVGWAAIGPTI